MLKDNEVGVFALGGLAEVGKNCYCIQYRDEIIVIDFGILFPDDSLFGVDAIIPNINYLKRNQDKIVALFITHGHLDHIGGIPILLNEIKLKKIYASGFAEGLIKKHIGNNEAKKVLKSFEEDDVIASKHFAVTFFKTNHSIPDSYGVIITTPVGNIVHTGDFKFDLTPISNHTNFIKISQVANSGVLALLSDSTNAALPGFTQSEKKVSDSIYKLLNGTTGRAIIASFASNIFRIKQIVEAAIKHNRKLHILGRSMLNNIKVSRDLGYISADEENFVDDNEVKNIPDSELVILCTGSQGEPLAALSRIANGNHKTISIKPGDTVIFSSSPIPGNRVAVNETINKVYRHGANVITNSAVTDTHTSGHGAQLEQALMIALVKPKYFVPIHGEYHMLVEHANTAVEVGIPKNNIHILDNGEILALSKFSVRKLPPFNTDGMYVRSRSISEISDSILKQRKYASENGFLSIILTVNKERNNLVDTPTLSSRGFVYMRENALLINTIKDKAKRVAMEIFIEGYSKKLLTQKLKEAILNIIVEKTDRNPIVLPVILELT